VFTYHSDNCENWFYLFDLRQRKFLAYFHQVAEEFSVKGEAQSHASVIIRIFRLAVEYDRNPTPVPRFFGHFFLFNIFPLSVLFIFSSPDASIEILLACSFEWFEVLKRHSITRHFRDPEEDRCHCRGKRETTTTMTTVTKTRGELLMPENGRSNSSTRIVRRVLMDYMSRRKPVDQREFIVTAFAIDIYSYLDKRLDVDVTLKCLTYT